MKKASVKLLISCLAAQIISSCSTFNFQRIEAEGAPIRQPVRLTDLPEDENYRLTVHTQFSYNGDSLISVNNGQHTPVNADGVFEVEPVSGETYFLERPGINEFDFEGENLFWEIPRWQAGVDFDFIFARSIAFTGGLGYSKLRERELWRQNAGIAFLRQNRDWAVRLDAGLHNYQSYHRSEYVERSDDFFSDEVPPDRFVEFFTTEGVSENLNFSTTLTFNTCRPRGEDYFISASYGGQTLASASGTSSEQGYMAFMAGISNNITRYGRLIFGGRLMNVIRSSEAGQSFLIGDLFVQFDINLIDQE